MSESKHTPGPWKIVEGTGADLREGWYVTDAENHSLWSLVGSDGAEFDDGGVTTLPNARLIAAAPDLLVVAKRAYAVLEVEAHIADPLVKQLRDAIAKAEG